MEMIDVLKNQLQDGMEISKVKILQNKTKFTFKYDGIEKQGEVENTCTIGYEQRLCRKAIDVLMSGIYIDKNQLRIAKKWLDGEMWDDANNKTETSTETRKEDVNENSIRLDNLKDYIKKQQEELKNDILRKTEMLQSYKTYSISATQTICEIEKAQAQINAFDMVLNYVKLSAKYESR